MIGFLKSRSLKKAATREAAIPPRAAVARAAEPPDRLRTPEPRQEPETEAIDTAETAAIDTALATGLVASPQRYEIRETVDGWSVYDNETVDTAKVYDYRLAKMNRSRAESLAAVLNRGEIRQRGRNG